jgi:putative transposase
MEVLQMSNYRRVVVPGGCFFFTVVTYERRPVFAEDAAVARLREGFRRVMAGRGFTIDAMVVLPDHLHCIWRLPAEDRDYWTRWRLIKHYVARGFSTGINGRGEKKVWQRRFWEHMIRDEEDWRRHVDYIHYNPVRHGYVRRPVDWIHGSFRRAVKMGWYGEDWGVVAPGSIEGMGLE